MKNENLLKPSEAAAMIGVSPNTFELMQAKNQTPAPVMIGKRRFWHKGILKAWIKSGFKTIEQTDSNKEEDSDGN